MDILVIFGSCSNPKVPSVSQFFMNMCSTPTPPSPPPPRPLNPLAKSWIPEAKNDQNFLAAKKSVIMYPLDFFSSTSTSPPCSPVVTLWPTPAINQPFQQLHFLPQSLSTTPYNFQDPAVYYFLVCYSNEAYWCNNPGCLQPQPYQHAVLPLFAPTLPLISWSCADDLREKVGENSTEKKRDSRFCSREKGWKTKTRFVPPRFERSQNMVHQGSKKTRRQEWKAKKTTGQGVVSVGAALVSSSTPPTESPIGDFQHSEKTTVMIRNIPNQYRLVYAADFLDIIVALMFRRNSLMQFLDLYCKNHNLEYDFFYLPMDFRRNDNLGYAFVNFTTPAAAMKIMDLLQDFVWYGNRLSGETIRSKKICEMSWADIQGKNALINHFAHSRFICDNFEFLPVRLSPPRNGSETRNRPIPVGKLTRHKKSPRLSIKKPSMPSSQPTKSNDD